MKPVMNTVGAFYNALAQRDARGLRASLADDFSFWGPMMQFDDPDAFTEMMVSFPFKATASGSRFIVDGNNVAHIFRWEMSAPVMWIKATPGVVPSDDYPPHRKRLDEVKALIPHMVIQQFGPGHHFLAEERPERVAELVSGWVNDIP